MGSQVQIILTLLFKMGINGTNKEIIHGIQVY